MLLESRLWSATNSLRIELESQGTLVTGVHLGLTDTDMVKDIAAPKNNPIDVAKQILDGIEHGAIEVLADDTTRQFKSALGKRHRQAASRARVVDVNLPGHPLWR